MAVSTVHRHRWLRLARGFWFIVLALVVGLTLFNIPFQWMDGQTVCRGVACTSNELSPTVAAQIQQAGLSPGFYAGYLVVLNIITVLVFVIVGSLIFWRKSNDWFGMFTAITLALAGFNFALGGTTPPPSMVEHYPALLFPVQFLNMAGTSTFFIFYFLFPNGRFIPRWLGWVAPIAILHGLIWAFRPDLLNNNDWTSYPAFAIAIAALIYRYRRVSTTFQRQQTKWVVFGSTVGIAGALVLNAFVSIVNPTGMPNAVNDLIGLTAWLVCLLLIPLSIGVAILRSHLWDVDILIRRSLIYGWLTALLALIYLGAVVALQAVFTAMTGQQRSELVSVLSTLAIAALFVPLRNRIQALIDRRFYRRKYDAARTLAEFGAAMRGDAAASLDDVSAHLLAAVDETMQPDSVALWLVKR